MIEYDYDISESFDKDNILHLKLFYMGCTIIPIETLKELL
jgi:hypothetical protein